MKEVMYLTKIEIDFEMAHRFGLRDSYAWHQKIWRAFPDRQGAKRNFLTRLDEIDGGFRLLLLSITKPTRPDWCPENAWKRKEIPNSFYRHRNYRFSLLANTTKKVRSNAKGELLKNSRRVPLIKREDLLDWLSRKAGQSGFVIEPKHIQTVPRPRVTFVKNGVAGQHCATEFIGNLQVKNNHLFRQAILRGIGPARAFGFGMLCLTPFSRIQ